MGTRNRQLIRKGAILFGIILAVAWLAPSFFSAERYRRRLETALTQLIKRPVTFGAAAFRLLPHPGFSVWNVVIHEDPAFGSEPLARVDRIDCDLRWHRFWRSRLSFSRLHLENPTLNAVRNISGLWNFESLLIKSGFTSVNSAPGESLPADSVDLDAEGGRINFKVGADKKPFAITDLTARLTISPRSGQIRYELTGRPVRTDLSLPTPGETTLTGVWTPGPNLRGSLNATLKSRESMLYDWIPLFTGRNPGFYGIVDATFLVSGSLNQIKFEGDGSVSQFYRWDLQPPSNSVPLDFNVRGWFNRDTGRVLVEKADVAFASSRVLLSGTIARIPAVMDLDLAVSLRQVRLEDMLALGRRFSAGLKPLGGSGRLEGRITVHGPAASRSYEGMVTGRDLRFRLPEGIVPVSEASLRIDNHGVRLVPVRIDLAPHLELVAQGEIERAPPSTDLKSRYPRQQRSGPSGLHQQSTRGARSVGLPGHPAASALPGPRYDLTFSAHALPLADLLKFAYQRGATKLRGIGAERGTCSGSLHFVGRAWPPTKPRLEGRLELSGGQIVLPGVSRPLTITHATVSVDGQRITADPILAAIGPSSFRGRLAHEGDRTQPWDFAVETGPLALDQTAPWFGALSDRAPSLFDHFPGLNSFTLRRDAASTLFAALNARGQFTASELLFHSLVLKDCVARVDVSDRRVKVTEARFRAAGGKGRGSMVADLSVRPPRLNGSISLQEVSLRSLTRNLRGPLRDARGTLAVTAGFASTGLSRAELAANFTAQGQVTFKNVSASDFDFLGALARETSGGALEPARHSETIRRAAAAVEVRDRRVVADFAPLAISGAEVSLRSTYAFGGGLNVDVRADVSHLARRWQSAVFSSGEDPGVGETAAGRHWEVHLTGDLSRLKPVPPVEVARSPASK